VRLPPAQDGQRLWRRLEILQHTAVIAEICRRGMKARRSSLADRRASRQKKSTVARTRFLGDKCELWRSGGLGGAEFWWAN